MNSRRILVAATLLWSVASCRPKPIDIEVPQQDAKLVVTASCLSESSVLVAAGYSVTSLRRLTDTSETEQTVPPDMVADSALVTIGSNGQLPDTLTQIRAGVYGSSNLRLQPGVPYILTVIDKKKNIAATATTTYLPKPTIERITPEVIRTATDTVIKLHVRIKNIQQGEHYFMCYNTMTQARQFVVQAITSLQSFEPKRMELFEECATSGYLEKTITLNANQSDTLGIHIGRADEHYYKYLATYKRTGYLINQITGEPINLPTNLSTGYGYFALYRPERRLIYLNEY